MLGNPSGLAEDFRGPIVPIPATIRASPKLLAGDPAQPLRIETDGVRGAAHSAPARCLDIGVAPLGCATDVTGFPAGSPQRRF